MKKLILMLLCFGALQIQAQQVVLVKDKNSPELLKFQQEVRNYNNFLKEKSEFRNKYAYEEFCKDHNRWEYSSQMCMCKIEASVDVVTKPTKLVYLLPPAEVKIVRDTIYKTKIKTVRDTISVVEVKRDTIQLPCNEIIASLNDPSVLVKHTSIDKQTKLDYSTEPVLPYLERRLYDYNGKYMGTVKVDPVNYQPIE